MAYNEAAFLPVWARHYARQVGADQCYVIDHGSTDDMVLPAGMNVVRLPRSAHDDERRAAFISDLTSALLGYYDWVIHTDVDELVVADPQRYRDLPTFCASLGPIATATTIGLDIQHVPSIEPPLDTRQPIGLQRGWVRFTSAMCKPVLTRQPLKWCPGFHCSQHPMIFAKLYLFHLHWADQSMGLSRLAKTRDMPWSGERFGAHQRVDDAVWLNLFLGMADLPRTSEVEFDDELPPIRDWLAATVRSGEGRSNQTFSIDLGINAHELWPIPPHFRARL